MSASKADSSNLVKQQHDSSLSCIQAAYCQRLSRRGYVQRTQSQYIGCVAHFAEWMRISKLPLHEFSSELITRFIQEHLPDCQCPGRVPRQPALVRAALRQLIPVFIDTGLSTKEPESEDVVQVELNRFDAYLRDQRGLAINTRNQRCLIVGGLLRDSLDEHQRLRPLNATMIRAFINKRLERWSPASAAVLAGSLRAYLRFRAINGDEVTTLLPVITSPACWKLGSLPQTLDAGEVESVLNSFVETLPSWRRGAAVAQCVARLGLRSNEVVNLELEDLDWESGTIRLRKCKSRRVDKLPLPVSVGCAIADYLYNERPSCNSRRVFVRHVAPVDVPLQSNLVGRIIRDAYQRCGLPYTRIHIFRHSLASRVLDSGGTLKEVADILRHRSLDTSQIYAKVDECRLSAVIMPWPGIAP